MVGSSLGPYQIVEKLGAGGMGEVYLAEDTRLRRQVAVKVLPAALAADPERVARLEREARVLAQVEHPCIAAIYGLEEAPGEDGEPVRFLVMQRAEGQDLGTRIAAAHEGRLPVQEALEIARRIAQALEAAHAQGIVHRDLKPANVMVAGAPGEQPRVKVLDFGLAKAFEAEIDGAAELSVSPTMAVAATFAGMILGTAAYMSPEQARGQTVDSRSDIWAFGCVLYEMLTGGQAFGGDTVSDAMASILKEEPDWSALPAATPRAVRRLLRRCLQKRPDERLHHIADARLEIEESLREPEEDNGAVAAGDATPATAPAAGMLPRVLPWVVAGLLGIVAVVGWWRPGEGAGTSVPRPPMKLTTELEGTVSHEALSTGLVLAPDGSWIAYLAGGEPASIYVRHIDRLESLPLPGTVGATSLFVSPDGEWLGFCAQGSLRKIRVDGGDATVLAPTTACRGGTWTVHDEIVYAPDIAGGLWAVPARGGTPVEITSPGEVGAISGHRAPFAMADGEHVLFVTTIANAGNYDDASINVVSLSTGEVTEVWKGGYAPSVLPGGQLAYVTGGRLLAAPFDSRSLKVTGEPVPLVQGMLVLSEYGLSRYSVSRDGTLAYLDVDRGLPPEPMEAVFVDRSGLPRQVVAAGSSLRYPRISPDGSQLLVVRAPNPLRLAGDVWLYDLENGGATSLVSDSTDKTSSPAWGPGPGEVTYDRTPEWRAMTVGRPGAPDVLASTGSLVAYGAWGAGGDVFFYCDQSAGNAWDIWTYRPGQGVSEWLSSPAMELFPQPSSDGRWVAYMSNETGRFQVYVRSFPDGKVVQNVSAAAGVEALYPRWSPDGHELYFRDGDGAMYAVPIELGDGTVRAGAPRRLFRGPYTRHGIYSGDYDVLPDGSGFLMFRPAAAAGPPRGLQVTLAFGWASEVERLFAGDAE